MMILRKKIYKTLFVALLVGGIIFHKSATFMIQKFPDIFGINSYVFALGFVYLVMTVSVLEYFVMYRIKHVDTRLKESQKSEYAHCKKVLDTSSDDEIGHIASAVNDVMGSYEKKIKELKKSDEMYLSVTEDAPLLICRFLPDGTIVFANKPYAKLYGKENENIIGSNVFDLIDGVGGDSSSFKRKLEMIRPGEDRDTCFHNAPVSESEPEWAMWINRGFFDEYGRIVEYQSVGLDIYQQAATGLNSMMNDILSLVYFVSEDGRLDYASPTNEKILGHNPSEMIGKSIFDYIHEENQKDIQEQIDKRFTEEEKSTSIKELRIKNNRNQYTWVQAAIDSIVASNGAVSNVAINARDITDLKTAREKITNAFNSMRKIIERVDTLEFIIEKSPVITFVWKGDNPFAEYVSGNITLLGYEKRDFIEGTVKYEDIVHPGDKEIMIEHMKTDPQQDAEIETIRYRLLGKDGKYHFVKDKTFVVKGEDNKVTYYKGIELLPKEPSTSMQKNSEAQS